MKYNFNAGPSTLPKEALTEAAQSVLDYNGTGLSILEISHRSKEFTAIIEEAISLIKEMLNIKDEYSVLFLSGGASSQFSMVPMNLLGNNQTAAYIDTGRWSSKAISDAKLFGQVDIIASSEDKNYSYIPKNLHFKKEYQYVHFTSNNTIYGTQFHEFPNTNLPLIADMSSDIFSREFDINRFDLIYAGAQKNIGPAGTTLVIVKKSAVGKTGRTLGAMLDYNSHINAGSVYNTPPVFPIYVSMLTLKWLKNMGGLKAINKLNHEKSSLLYNEIESNPLFQTPVPEKDRSLMNVIFTMKDAEMEKSFLDFCTSEGCVGIKGHRSVGGFRVSLYNSMTLEGTQKMVDLMREFTAQKG